MEEVSEGRRSVPLRSRTPSLEDLSEKSEFRRPSSRFNHSCGEGMRIRVGWLFVSMSTSGDLLDKQEKFSLSVL